MDKNYIEVPKDIIDNLTRFDRTLDFSVYILLLRNRNVDYEVSMSINEIREYLKAGKATIVNAIRNLENMGLIKKNSRTGEHGGSLTNLYTVNDSFESGDRK